MVQAMSDAGEFDFQPRLGRIRSQGRFKPKGIKSFLKSARKKSGKMGSGGARTAAFAGARRVMIKARVYRLSAAGGGAQRAHISYLERDGAGKDREPADFYDELTEGINGQEWLKEHADERHHFRFIVSPEDGEKLKELKPFVRDLVSQMEIDLETKLDWVAVDHYNTEHPHTHIVMSGKRDDGRDLVISKDYLSRGMRERGSALLTRELGLQSEPELSAKLSQETCALRVTRMDQVLLRETHRNGEIDLSKLQRNRDHYGSRLNKLRDLGLAKHLSGSVWVIDEKLGTTLRAMEKSDEIAKRIEKAVQAKGLDRISAHELGRSESYKPVTGRLLKIGYANEIMDSRYTIVDGLDGRAHHFHLGTSYPKDLQIGDMIEIKPRSSGALEMDRIVADVARKSSNIYDQRNHQRVDPQVGDKTLSLIQNRLGALERARLIDRNSNGSVSIDAGFVDRVDKHFSKIARQSPSIVRKLEHRQFETQVQAIGETWLDQRLAGIVPEQVSEAGLGGEVRKAMTQRMKVLHERGHVVGADLGRLTGAQLKKLQQEGMAHAASEVARQTGLQYRALQPGEKIEGTFTRTHSSGQAKYGVVEHAKEFSLIPWKSSLERLRKRQIGITMSRGRDISWTMGRSRGLSR